jgi:hypothetical protein
MNVSTSNSMYPSLAKRPPTSGRVALRLALASALVAMPFLASGQETAKPVSLEEALRQIEALKKQVNALETVVKEKLQERPASTSVAIPAATTPPPAAPRVPEKAAENGFVKWNELSLGKSKFKLYGFLRLDAIYDDSRPSNTQVP